MITNEKIEALMTACGAVGDLETIALCRVALGQNEDDAQHLRETGHSGAASSLMDALQHWSKAGARRRVAEIVAEADAELAVD